MKKRDLILCIFCLGFALLIGFTATKRFLFYSQKSPISKINSSNNNVITKYIIEPAKDLSLNSF